jgi:cell division protein FtsW
MVALPFPARTGRRPRANELTARAVGQRPVPAQTVRAPWVAPDYRLLLIIAALLMFGLIMVYSASVVTAYTTYGNQFYFLNKQLLSACIGLTAMFAFMWVDYRRLRSLSVLGLAVAVVLLVAVLIPGLGAEVYGAQRWIAFGGFQLQPSELTKLALVLYVSHWLTTKNDEVSNFAYGLVPFMVLMAVVTALLMKQPDMGTTIVVVATAVSIFFAAGANLWHLGLLSGLGAFAGVLMIWHAPYRMERLLAFVNPWDKPLATGYHVVQSLLAFGAGSWMGVGLGVGRQKFMYLPFPHTDSIFAVVGEELGLAGTVVVVMAFVFFAYRGLRIAWYAPDQFGRLLAVGITCGIAFQAVLNIAVLTSSVPFTGITLPFISYGGSSLMATLAACGILLNVSRQISATGGARGEGSGGGRRHRRPHLPRLGRGPRSTSV